MPRNVAEFQDDTSFERFILDRTMPLLPPQAGGVVVDLRGSGVSTAVRPATIHVSVSDSMGARGGLGVDDLRPLIFGTAWKVLDILVELALEAARVPHDDGQRYRYDTKAGKAGGGGVAAVVPFDSRQGLWSRLMRLYASTETLRHHVVHRKIKVDLVTGDMETVPESGQPVTRISHDEQSAFCRASQGAAEAVIAGDLPTRRDRQLRWVLDQLTAHHGQAPFGVKAVVGVIPTVLVSAEQVFADQVAVNLPEIRARAKAATPDRSYFNLRVHLPDGRILEGESEDAPRRRVTFDANTPPDWLRWV